MTTITKDPNARFVVTPRKGDYEARTRTITIEKSDHPELYIGSTVLVRGRRELMTFYFERLDQAHGETMGWWYSNRRDTPIHLLIIND